MTKFNLLETAARIDKATTALRDAKDGSEMQTKAIADLCAEGVLVVLLITEALQRIAENTKSPVDNGWR